jgi:flagellar biogenesis protein FliO
MFRPTHIALCVLLSAVAALAVDDAPQAAPTSGGESNQPVAIPTPTPEPAAAVNSVAQPPSAVSEPAPSSPSPSRERPGEGESPKVGPASVKVESAQISPKTTVPEIPTPLLVPEPPAPQESLPLVPSDNADQPVHAAAVPPGSSHWLLQTFLALGIVIGLIFALRYLVQRLGGAATSAAHVAPLVEVLARTNIAPKTQMMFLKINQRLIVVAQSPAGLQPITTFDDPEDIAWALTQIESAKPLSITQGFRQIMHRFDGDYDPEAAESGGSASSDEQHIDRTHNQMSSLLSRIRNLSRKE